MMILWLVLRVYLSAMIFLGVVEWIIERYFMRPDHKFGRPGLGSLLLYTIGGCIMPFITVGALWEQIRTPGVISFRNFR